MTLIGVAAGKLQLDGSGRHAVQDNREERRTSGFRGASAGQTDRVTRNFVVLVDHQHIRRIEVPVIRIIGRSIGSENDLIGRIIVIICIIHTGDGHQLLRTPIGTGEDQS